MGEMGEMGEMEKNGGKWKKWKKCKKMEKMQKNGGEMLKYGVEVMFIKLNCGNVCSGGGECMLPASRKEFGRYRIRSILTL